jgi:uncharacterized protein
MSATLPPQMDIWRMVANQRRFEGSVPLAQMPRLVEVLADSDGECRYVVEFYRDPLKIDVMHIQLSASLPLICQRSLERFVHQVEIDQRLGLISEESQEAAMPEGMEAVLVDRGGDVSPLELIEDELLLAVPLVPVSPNASELDPEWVHEEALEEDKPNPFAALQTLKDHK